MRRNLSGVGRTIAGVFLSAVLAGTSLGQTPLKAPKIAGGFDSPVDIQSAPGDKERLFIVEQDGRIQLIKNGVVLPDPFLNIPNRIGSGGEQGLLGLAFHPDYQTNLYFYVYYTDLGGDTIIERFERRPGNPDRAAKNTGVVLMGPISQPYSNHNGGQLAFGQDGYLYIGFGDGGSANDPGCRAQDGSTFLGKMLRIDVDGGFPYAIPPDNPFVGDGSILDEIWHFGHRNPWRWSFDSVTGDMYIADVGQNAREEISFQFGSSSGGENFGWKIMEGRRCNSTSGCANPDPCNDPSYTDPIFQYTHSLGCSITGGYVYRGCAIPDLDGTYFYADYCSDRVWSFRYDGNNVTDAQERTNELDQNDGSFNSWSAFGQDQCGEIYMASLSGDIFMIQADAPTTSIDLGFGKVGANGLTPQFTVCGLLDSGNTAEFTLENAPPSQFGLMFIALEFNPTPAWGGTVVPLPPIFFFPATMDSSGEWGLTAPGGLGVLDFYMQWVFNDPGNSADTGISNAVHVFWLD